MQVGEAGLTPLSDGTFVARPSYFVPQAASGVRLDVFDRGGAAWLPIGCFLVQTDDRVILVDAGLGPELTQLPDGMCLVGGQLLTGLRAAGVALDAVNDVICTHLHSDYVGWLFDLHGDPVFPEATIWFSAADWCHFVEGPGEMSGHIEAGFRRWVGTSRVRPVEKGATVVRGVEVVPTPGHTPGHLCVVIESRGRRLLFLGDAITCPVQIEEPSWHSFGDVDPQLAAGRARSIVALTSVHGHLAWGVPTAGAAGGDDSLTAMIRPQRARRCLVPGVGYISVGSAED